jgi:Ser/Thr protein kinase RdoA (MazF antagonist)
MEGMALEFNKGGRDLVLKITPKAENKLREVNQLKQKLEFVDYLADHGVRVAQPLRSPKGNWVEVVETDQTIYLVNLLTKVAGKHFNLYHIPGGDRSFFQRWGQVTGQMHRLAKIYKSWQKTPDDDSQASEINTWKEEFQFFAQWCQFEEVRQKWIELGQQLEILPRNREAYGLIHNDLHPWNMIVNEVGEITVIDFDVCTFHFFIKDIAIALFHVNWSGNPGKGASKEIYLNRFFQSFMRGYAQENTLDGYWFKQLPLFIKHHHILLFTVFTDEWKTPNKWQSKTLRKWKQQIINDTPFITLQF